jgi:hypothetical protein
VSRRHAALILATLATSIALPALAQPKELLALKGQPIQPVLAKLGPPASQEPAANGATTYRWAITSRVETPTRTTRMDYTMGQPNPVETVEIRPQSMTCNLRLVADTAGTISEVDPNGPFPACAAVVDKLQGN